jgi:hypothetical protein
MWAAGTGYWCINGGAETDEREVGPRSLVTAVRVDVAYHNSVRSKTLSCFIPHNVIDTCDLERGKPVLHESSACYFFHLGVVHSLDRLGVGPLCERRWVPCRQCEPCRVKRNLWGAPRRVHTSTPIVAGPPNSGMRVSQQGASSTQAPHTQGGEDGREWVRERENERENEREREGERERELPDLVLTWLNMDGVTLCPPGGAWTSSDRR